MSFAVDSLESRTLNRVAERVFKKAQEGGPEGLSAAEQTFRLVWAADGSIGGEGIWQIFELWPQYLPPLLPQAYLDIGAPVLASIIEKAVSLLPVPLSSFEERLDQVMEIQEYDEVLDGQIHVLGCEYIDESEDSFEQALYQFVLKHRAELLDETPLQ